VTTDYLFEDMEHFEEGLVHLVDMLELADPRRRESARSQRKVQGSGLSVPVGGTFDEWKSFCQDVSRRLRATRGRLSQPAALAQIDAAIDRIDQMVQDQPGTDTVVR